MSAPVLAHPDLLKSFILKTDASQYAVGAVLSQLPKLLIPAEHAEVVCEYFSRPLKGAQLNWTATVRECYAVLLAVQHFREYLHRPFTLVTDHRALLYMWTRPFGEDRKVARWANIISMYPVN